jgi:hypothetical protein
MEKHDVDFAYWPLNVGMKPTPSPSDVQSHEGYGFLTNDWSPRWHDERLRLLRRLIPTQRRHTSIASTTFSSSSFPPPPPALIDVSTPLVMLPAPWCHPLPGPLLPMVRSVAHGTERA